MITYTADERVNNCMYVLERSLCPDKNLIEKRLRATRRKYRPRSTHNMEKILRVQFKCASPDATLPQVVSKRGLFAADNSYLLKELCKARRSDM